MKTVDYSDRAISTRIKRVGQLRTLCLEELVNVRDVRALTVELIEEAGRLHDLPDAAEEDLFGVFLPEAAAESAIYGSM